MAPRYRKNIGDWGEDIAVGFLRRRKFEIVERNFHTPAGEIDIVAKYGGDYYFVEVKTRREAALAGDDAITPFKRMKLMKAIKSYCYRRGIGGVGITLAGIFILANKEIKTVKIRFVIMR